MWNILAARMNKGPEVKEGFGCVLNAIRSQCGKNSGSKRKLVTDEVAQ